MNRALTIDEAADNLRVSRRWLEYWLADHPVDAAGAWSWGGVIKRASIKRLTPHCCRHGFATGLLRRGVDVVTIAKLGGWTSPAQVFATYGHANDDPTLTDLLTTPTNVKSVQIFPDDVENPHETGTT